MPLPIRLLTTLVLVLAYPWAGVGSSVQPAWAVASSGPSASADPRHSPVDQDRGMPCGESLGYWGIDDGEEPEDGPSDLVPYFWAASLAGAACPVLDTSAPPLADPPPAARYLILLRFRC